MILSNKHKQKKKLEREVILAHDFINWKIDQLGQKIKIKKLIKKLLGHERLFMRNFVFPINTSLYEKIRSVKHGLQLLKQELSLKGNQEDINKIHVISAKNTYITYLCAESRCPWVLEYTKEKMENQEGRQVFILTKFQNRHCHINPDQINREDEDQNNKIFQILEDRKKHEQIMHDERAFGFLNRLIGLSYQQIGQYYAYLDDSICTTYLIGRISYELRKMMADPKKYTFFQWLQINKNVIRYVSDFSDVESEERLIQTPYFFFFTTKYWKRLYKERGKILGVKTFEDRIIQKIEGEEYSCCIFFGLLPNLQLIIFAFAFYKKEQRLMTSSEIKKLARLRKIKESQIDEKMYKKMDVGLYKSIRIFFQHMGYNCQSLITDCHPEIVNTAQIFLNKLRREKPNDLNLPNHLVDPTAYIQNNLPESVRNLAMQLVTDPIKYATAKQAWQKRDYSISEEQILCLEKFEKFCERYPIFGLKNASLTADWFGIYKNITSDDPTIFNIKYLLGKLDWKLYKRSLAGILETALFLGNKTYRIYKKSTYKLFHSDFLKIQNACYTSQAFPHHVQTKINEDPEFIAWAKSIRNILFRQGFGLLIQQLSRSGETDIIDQKFDLEDQSPYPIEVQFGEDHGGSFVVYECKVIEEDQEGNEMQTLKYECSCKFPIIKGVPCKHILKICKFYQLKIQDYISPYWKLTHSYEQIFIIRALEMGTTVKKRGKPKGTHTNKIK